MISKKKQLMCMHKDMHAHTHMCTRTYTHTHIPAFSHFLLHNKPPQNKMMYVTYVWINGAGCILGPSLHRISHLTSEVSLNPFEFQFQNIKMTTTEPEVVLGHCMMSNLPHCICQNKPSTQPVQTQRSGKIDTIS